MDNKQTKKKKNNERYIWEIFFFFNLNQSNQKERLLLTAKINKDFTCPKKATISPIKRRLEKIKTHPHQSLLQETFFVLYLIDFKLLTSNSLRSLSNSCWWMCKCWASPPAAVWPWVPRAPVVALPDRTSSSWRVRASTLAAASTSSFSFSLKRCLIASRSVDSDAAFISDESTCRTKKNDLATFW